MADNVSRLTPRKARRLRETVYTERGLRLSPVARLAHVRWFVPCVIALPIAAFMVVFLW